MDRGLAIGSGFPARPEIFFDNSSCGSRGFLLGVQRIEAGDHVEEFFVDAALAEAIEAALESDQEFVDVFIGALHGGEAAGVFARERFGTGAEERDEEIFAD